MQNIPGTATEPTNEPLQLVKLATTTKTDKTGKGQSSSAKTSQQPADTTNKHTLFADVLDEHTEQVQEELALAPVSHKDKMLEAAPETEEETTGEIVSAAGNKRHIKKETKTEGEDHDLENRMTQEDLDNVKAELEAYGMSEEEIAKIETQVNSEQGMTWKQLAAAIAEKIEDVRSAKLSDGQKESLGGFFNKLGFSETESDQLISDMENGDLDTVMNAVQAKVAAMSEGQSLLLNPDEVTAFTSAMGFSQEITSKVQELLGTNTLSKDLKKAFTLIRQETAKLDQKDLELVKAVGKAFAESVGETLKESSAARQLEEAVDLKPRVAEEGVKTELKEELAQAFKTREDAMTDATSRGKTEKALSDKVEIKTETQTVAAPADGDVDVDSDDQNNQKWNDFFDKMRQDPKQSDTAARSRTKAAEVADAAKATLAQAEAKATATAASSKAWEKVSAPKVMKQVNEAVLKTLNNGTKQLTLQLSPENLGKLSIVLSVQGKEVSATIKAENADASKVIADHIHIIKESLESQGLRVDKLDVQTGLTDNQSSQNWFGENEHNLSREREAMIAMRNHMRSMRQGSGTGVARDVQLSQVQAISADQGLHLIA